MFIIDVTTDLSSSASIDNANRVVDGMLPFKVVNGKWVYEYNGDLYHFRLECWPDSVNLILEKKVHITGDHQ